MKNEMICDKIVVSIQDSSLSEQLQLDAPAHTRDSKESRPSMWSSIWILPALTVPTTLSSAAAIQPQRKQRAKNKGAKMNYRRKQTTGNTQAICSRCGRQSHWNCRAKDAVCSKSGKQKHFAAVCQTKTSTANEVMSSSPAVAFLDNLTPESNGKCGQHLSSYVNRSPHSK